MKQEITYANSKIEFDLAFSNRKTIKISVEAPDIITVTAPRGVPKQVVIESVRNKSPWILKRLYLIKNAPQKPMHQFLNGESFLYLGGDIVLELNENSSIKKAKVELIDKKLVVCVSEYERNTVRTAIEQWYRKETMHKAVERVEYYKQYFNTSPNSLKVKQQKRRWASCTYKDDILFNWRCIMAKEEAFDYIVVHEMCHMVHKNHSKDFWKLVEQIMPDYKVRKAWLTENGIRMDF